MQMMLRVASLAGAFSWGATAANPLGTVIALIDELAAKIVKDGETAQKAYEKYFEWCDETNKDTSYAIETAEKEKEKLEAKLEELSSDIQASGEKIDELAAAIAKDDEELEDATVIRKKEADDFAASEAELVKAIDALSRAIGILDKEMSKNPAAFAQVDARTTGSLVHALGAVLDAAAFPSEDQSRLMAFVQSQQGEGADDDDSAAPAAATYKTHSGGIMDVLEDMKSKADGQLSDLRKAETNTKHNFQMLKQSLEDQMAADTKDMEEEKAKRAASEEAKATANSELDVATKELASSSKQLETARTTCLQVASDHQVSVAGRTEELNVIAEAKKILIETTKGAESQTYSLLQVSAEARLGLAGSEVVAAVKQLAKTHHSAALAQLASRIGAVVKLSSASGANPFGKVKGLIRDMIAKLEKEGNEEAAEKAFCDEQMAKTEAKKSELEQDVARMTNRIDRAASKSAELKAQIQELEAELAALAKQQAEMDEIRQEERAAYEKAKADLELGLTGVRKALKVLGDYYGASSMLQEDTRFDSLMQQPAPPVSHSKSSGAGGGIIDILEVCESDFAKNLAEVEKEEEDEQSQYEKTTQENAVAKTNKEQDVKFKGKESKALDRTAAEYSADREVTNKELSAVLEYYGKIKDRCVAVPETYEERKARREAEIQGLKQALSILEDETALMQRGRRGGNFRGSVAASL